MNDWILDREIDVSLASFAEDDSGKIAACNQRERTRRDIRECYLSKRRNNTVDVLRDFILLYVPCYR